MSSQTHDLSDAIMLARGAQLDDQIESGQRLEISIHRPANEPIGWNVDEVNLRGAAFTNAIRFKDENGLTNVFPSKLAMVLQHYLDKATDKPQVISLPDACIVLEDLVLGGLRIFIYRLHNGLQRAMVRFKQIVGSLTGLITHHEFRNSATSTCEDLVTRTILDLISPCIALTDLDENTRDSKPVAIENAFNRIKKNREELIFYEYLLKRYLAQGPKQLSP